MSHLFPNYHRSPITFVKAENNSLYDSSGKAYLDFSSGIGVTNLGFHSALVASLSEQVQTLWHTPNLYQNPLQEEVADLLIGERDYLAYFCNSGAESNEAAIKLARKATGKSDIIAFKNSFHGRTFGAMSATGQEKIQKGFGPLLSGFQYASFNDLASVEALISENTAAVMLELVQGESGVHPADKAFIKGLETLCHEQNILLIVDEVQTGMGRTGTLFAFEQYEIEPDIVTLAKGLANGVPVGAMLGRTSLAHAFGPGSHGSTFGGNVLAMSASKATLQILKEPGFLEEASAKGDYLMTQLKDKLQDCVSVFDLRGLGLMVGIETSLELSKVVEQARAGGLILLTAGTNTIRLLPPLTVTSAEIDQAVNVLQKVLA
ncbi:acetylornithine transaminase [Streptococcus moroccensis]|uniref:Acetylornithine aminotransferase n=1 Tax=Streptococcus moroccensis TaxID=1451356 RepID=A0ABT9YN97_9STRE|nr:acetylornithine transaminase [Streptococcus moroccensis]MDQ0221473.1 acetylornithine aminotransferase [Streptococcus moroccensis]